MIFNVLFVNVIFYIANNLNIPVKTALKSTLQSCVLRLLLSIYTIVT